MKSIRKIATWLLQQFGFGLDFKIRTMEDPPEKERDGVIYIIGGIAPWLLSMHCPCGCGETIQLNLLKEGSPCWNFKVHQKKITLNPSVWRTIGCKSHFIISKGQVRWVK
jgi:hypothetical protein